MNEIKASDLRVGNLVQRINRDDNNYTIKAIEPIDIVGQHQCDIAIRELFEGIPLTEEWLLNFSFRRVNDYHLFFKQYGQVDFNVFSWETPVGQSNGVPAGEFYMTINGVMIILNTVHQLQNLYHSLTGKELTIQS